MKLVFTPLALQARADDKEDLTFCRWMRKREPWALEQWKQAWKTLTKK